MDLNKRIKEHLKLVYIPLSLFVIYLLMILLWKLFGLPDNEKLIFLITDFFNKYGLITVFVGALIEGFFLVGQYFPGGFIIFLGVISAGKNIFRATEVVLVVMIAFLISYSLNYLVGRFGWYKLFEKFGLKKPLRNFQKKLKKRGLSVILLNYWEPNLSSIVATAAGVLKLPFKKFFLYSLLGIVIWETFWGALVFILGSFALELMGLKYGILILILWIVAIYLNEYLRKT